MKNRVTRFLVVLWMSAVWLVAAAVAQGGGQNDDGPYGGQSSPGGNPQVDFPRSGSGGDPQLHYPQQGQPGDPDGGQQPADPQSAGPQSGDPQAAEQKNAVARVSLIRGEVSMQRGDSPEWVAAPINTPLLRGDQVATGERSSAEVQLDYANILRLSARSQAKIAELTRTEIQIQIAEGYTNLTQFKGSEADVEINTPNVAVHPLRAGRYRVQVNSAEETDVIVREGEAEIMTPQGSTKVHEGQMITIRGSSNPEYKVSGAPHNDDWDQFNKDRDRQIRNADSWHRTNEYYTGAHDLDGNGRWIFIPGYGQVWQPYQDDGWAPYQAGRWVWEPYYGWTWVSYEPWGWAPYHYGRWFFWGASWVWWPGPVYPHYRPYWGPAFVTFIGFGHGVGFGAGFGYGHIGWLPCGPHDYYYPWYGRYGNHVNVVSITNINVHNGNRIGPLAGRWRGREFHNIDMAMRNPRVRGGISGVSAEQFGRGNAQVRRLDIREGDMRQARVMTAALPVVPTRDSLHAGGPGRTPQQLGIQTRNQDRFFTRQQPAGGRPAFRDEQNRMQGVVTGRTSGAQGPVSQSPNQQRGPGSQGRPEFHTQPAVLNRTGGETRGNVQVPQQPASGSARRPVGADRGNPGVDQSPSRGGWTRFGSPGGRSASGDSGRSGPINTPPGSPRIDNVQVPRGDRGIAQSGRSVSTPPASSSPRNEDRGGWQRFPDNYGDRTRQTTAPRDNRGSSKPPLQLERPIVIPRNEGPRAENPRSMPPPSRVPEMRSEPMSVPPVSRVPETRNEPRYAPPPSRAPEMRNAPRNSPPPSYTQGRSESRGGYSPRVDRSGGSRGGDRGGSRSGGGNRGGSGDKGSSKSSSGPKGR